VTAGGVDFEAEVAVFADDVTMGVSAEHAAEHIKLLALVNDVSLRGLIPEELAKGFGFFESKPSSAFSPVCVTTDELGSSWCDAKVCLPLLSHLNDKPFGRPNAGTDMTFNFSQLISHAARSRNLVAGSIIGSGTVSNKLNGGPGRPLNEGGLGYSCIAEIRMIEAIEQGQPHTPFMVFGDRVRIEMFDSFGDSIFGATDQQLVKHN
jgi:fumarylacetoacetate (FAA) hydrolase